MFDFCNKPCTHGDVCTNPAGHDGMHDASGLCQWDGDSGITMEEVIDMVRLQMNKMNAPLDIAEFIIDITGQEG